MKEDRAFLFKDIGIGVEFRFIPTDLDRWWVKASPSTANLIGGHNSVVCEPDDEVEVGNEQRNSRGMAKS